MKNITLLLIAGFLFSCQSEKGKQSDLMVEMSQKNLEYLRKYGNDSRAKMILTYGQDKVDWFDSMTVVLNSEFDAKDSIEQAKIDSVNKQISQ